MNLSFFISERITCTFEMQFICGYHMRSSGNSYKWIKHTESTPTSRTGPSSDHTTGRGTYSILQNCGLVQLP